MKVRHLGGLDRGSSTIFFDWAVLVLEGRDADGTSYIVSTTRPVIVAARISSKTSLICSSLRVST